MTLLVVLAASAAIVALAGVVVSYNRFVGQRAYVRSSWSGIDVELARRHDLVGGLVEVVAGYAVHERTVLHAVARLRAAQDDARVAAVGGPERAGDRAGVARRAAAEEALGEMLESFLGPGGRSVIEALPELAASERFLALQRELAATEDRIAVVRRQYNRNVAAYNGRVRRFPSNLLARLVGFEQAQFFGA